MVGRATLRGIERELLARARVGHLATVSRTGGPSVVPVCFVLIDDRVYSALDEKPKSVPPTQLRRVRDLLGCPQVALVADEYDEDWRRLAFVQVRGSAGLIGPEQLDHAVAVRALREKYAQYRSMAIEARPMLRIAVEQVRSWAADPDRFRG